MKRRCALLRVHLLNYLLQLIFVLNQVINVYNKICYQS